MPTSVPARFFQLKRGTAARWASANPVLADGEIGLITDTGSLKFGDGTSTWTDLPDFFTKANMDFRAKSFTADGSVRGAFIKTTSLTDHAATFYKASTSGSGVAINGVSDNPDDSTMFLSGVEKTRGTLKIAHNGYADASDSGASGLSIDTRIAGSAARGIYLWSSEGGQTGDSITVRRSSAVTNLSREDFVVKASGRCGIGIGLGSTPAAQLEIAQPDDSTPGLSIRARSATASNLIEARRSSDGAVRTRISRDCQLVTQETAFFNGPAVQIGPNASTQVGGGTNCMGLSNASVVPTSNPTGGGVMYAEGGALKWRGSNGTVTVIAPA